MKVGASVQGGVGISAVFWIGMTLAVGGLTGCTVADMDGMFPGRQAALPQAVEPTLDLGPLDAEPAAGPFVFPMPLLKPKEPARPVRLDRMQPSQLVGIGQDDASRVLGPATTVRDVPPATVWEYRADGCAVDLFFYMDVQEKRFRALAYDIKTNNGDRQDALENCLAKIRNMGRG